ncbi:MAG: entericidin A/B family lipoprotein [Burkholderiaceae bacterium]|nr:entericidin A/B family lipoprotein [Burkholderiaceae bacterium]
MKSLMLIALAAAAALLAGCNTVKGMGQDVQKAGAAIEKSAK